MSAVYHYDLVQGSGDWLQARCGLLTASEMHLIITPSKLKAAVNDKERSHFYELLSQRVTNYVKPSYDGPNIWRGHDDEIRACEVYNANYEETKDVGFITNDRWGFTLGFSPDGLVGEGGLIEAKSREPKYQVETIIKNEVPAEHIIQVQTGMLVAEREWCDYLSYCGGLPMAVIREYADPEIQKAIVDVAALFEARMTVKMAEFYDALEKRRFIATERHIEQEMFV